MQKLNVLFFFLILSVTVFAQESKKDFCQALTIESKDTIYHLNRIEHELDSLLSELLFNSEFDDFTSELFKMYHYINDNNTLSELNYCSALEQYGFAKKLIYAAAFVHQHTRVLKITENVGLDASLIVNALLNSEDERIDYYIHAFFKRSPAYLREVTYVVILESQHSAQLRLALNKYHENFRQFEFTFIQTPEDKSYKDLSQQFVLLSFFSLEEYLLDCFKQLVALDTEQETQFKNILLIRWLVSQSFKVNCDYIYPFILAVESYFITLTGEQNISEEYVVQFIKEARNGVID